MSQESITISLGGEDRELRFERRYIYRLENVTKVTLVETFQNLQRGSYKAIVDLAWCGLQHNENREGHEHLASMSLEDVAEWVEWERLGEIADAIAEGVSSIVAADGKKKESQSEPIGKSESVSGPEPSHSESPMSSIGESTP